MTDVHCHLIPFVDDGSDSLEKSLDMLMEEKSQGVDRAICSPHSRRGKFETSREKIQEEFERLKAAAADCSIGVDLFLGGEFRYEASEFDRLIQDHSLPTINGGKYILLEFDFHLPDDIEEACYDVKTAGYKPIIAHIERYFYFRDVKSVERVKASGALVQVNAESVASRAFPEERRFVKKLLKKKLVDFVASDVHVGRTNYMRKAFEIVAKKDAAYAEQIFKKNGDMVLGIE